MNEDNRYARRQKKLRVVMVVVACLVAVGLLGPLLTAF